MDYVKIIINDIPFYPVGVSDSKYIPGRIVFTGLNYSVVAKTEEQYYTVNNQYIKRERPIQTRVYDQYELISFAKENIPVEILENSDNLQVQFDQNDETVTWDIMIPPGGVEKEKQANTYDYRYTINFVKLEPDSLTINNFLSYDYLQNTSYVADLVKLELQNGKNKYTEYSTSTAGVIRFTTTTENDSLALTDTVTVNVASNTNENFPVSGTVTAKNSTYFEITHSYLTTVTTEFEIFWEKTLAVDFDFYTALVPTFDTGNTEAVIIENEGSEVVSDYYNYDVLTASFVLSDDEKNRFVKYLDYCDTINIVYDSVTYRKQSGYRPTYEIKSEGLINLHFIILNLKYNKKNFNVYE